MGARFDQLLGYLDRDGVSELVIATGRPIAIRQGGDYAMLTSKPLTRDQLAALLADSPIDMPDRDGTQRSFDITIGKRELRVQVGRRGDDIVVRIERAPARPRRTTKAPAPPDPTPAPPAARMTSAPSAPSARVKTPTAPPRSQPPSLPPTELALHELMPVSGTFAELVAAARARGATDLHIATGRAVALRIAGELSPLDPDGAVLGAAATEAMLLGLLEPTHQARLASAGYTDLAVDAPGGGRLRANISRHQGGLKGTFRLAHATPSTLDELGLPKELAKAVSHHQGLVVIAGPSGHGKTTTLAALVDLINGSKRYHILTIEDPIEIVHPRKIAVVSQREAGRHTRSFATGLKASLREDPDVIVIGELRDRETVEIALTAAETGHLVLSTMSTPSAAKTLDRLIDMFPSEEHSQVRASVAGALRAIVAQRLVPSTSGGVVPAVELVTGVLPLAVLIRDDKLYQLPNLMQRGRAFGMIRFDDSLLELLRAGKVTEAAALAVAENKKEFANLLHPKAKP